MHKGIGGVKAVSVTPSQSRWQAEPQPLLNSPFTICGATCPPQMLGQVRKEREKLIT